ncbi:MAG TPA: sulfurtransferase, partial [Candidatus Nanopelagicales bacterium]|nr:sulfurtransferase [Candidatus Nanopelagicales bacterium]
DPRLRIVDVTTRLSVPEGGGGYTAHAARADFEAAHLPGAVYADLNRDLSDPAGPYPFTLPSPEQFAAAAAALGIGEQTHVVAYDSAGTAWASRLWWLLRYFGSERVSVLDGGLAAWTAAGLRTESGASPPVAVNGPALVPRSRPELVATTAELAGALGSPGLTVVNALDPATFAGTSPVCAYSRRGRIPGSRNLPFFTLLDPNTGRLRPAHELTTVLAGTGLVAARRPVTYCGGGVAATLPAFVAFLCHGTEVAVYDGLLAEWTAEPALPIELG